MGAEAAEEVVDAPEEVVDEYAMGKDFVFAARTGDFAAVKKALADGVAVNFRDTRDGANGWTALKWAASEGHTEVLTLLLDHDAAAGEVEVDALSEGPSSGTPLHWAAFKGHIVIVWRLLTCKPKFSAKDLDGELNSPLHLAAAGGHLGVIKTMLGQGVEVKGQNAYGNLPVQLSTDAKCQALLKEAATASMDGRFFLCACSGEFCTEENSVADIVIDRVSTPDERPVRYSSECATQIRTSEEELTAAIKAGEVPKLEEAIAAAQRIGASMPMIHDATKDLARLNAQIGLDTACTELQEARPVTERMLLRAIAAPLKQARETDVAASIIEEADRLCATVEAEIVISEQLADVQKYKMVDESEEEGSSTEPPSAESDMAKRADGAINKLIDAIDLAQSLSAMGSVTDLAEAELAHLTAEADLRKSLMAPKEGVTEDGTPCQTQYNGTQTYSALEDLVFRNDFLDSSVEKCVASGTAPGVVLYAQKVQKDLKVKLKEEQVLDEERKAKEAAAAAKAAKKKKGKK